MNNKFQDEHWFVPTVIMRQLLSPKRFLGLGSGGENSSRHLLKKFNRWTVVQST